MDDELLLCEAPLIPSQEPAIRKLKDGSIASVGIRGEYYGQCPVLQKTDRAWKDAGLPRKSPVSPSALSQSTREPSCERPESRSSSASDCRGGFRQSRGRMLLERGARSATPTLKENGLYHHNEHSHHTLRSRPTSQYRNSPALFSDDDLGSFQLQDEEVLAITAAASRNAFDPMDPSSPFQDVIRASPFTPRESPCRPGSSFRGARVNPQVPSDRNWRGGHRPSSAHESPDGMFLGPGPKRAGFLGCETGHSTQYSCLSESWWRRSPGSDRRRQGDFQRVTLPSQEPGWDSELGYLACGCDYREACPHWPSGRPVKASVRDPPSLPGAEGGQAKGLGLSLAPPPKVTVPKWFRSQKP